MRKFFLPLLAASLAAACGQKGNLYLPEDRVVVAPATPALDPATATPAPAASATPAVVTPTAEDRERENAARNRAN